MLTRWFAHPWMLVLLAVPPALGALALVARWRRRRRLARLGPPAAVAALREGPPLAPWRTALAWTLGFALLAAGTAGPRLGGSVPPAVAGGRDVVIVLDLSRSMLAADVLPNRLGRCRAALRDFADAVEARGGHRLALVAFAGRAQLVCPLTVDYDHFRAKLGDLDAEQLPAALRPPPGAVSGTRIGAGLRRAVETHDPRFRGAQDILLLSDGDDPAGDDEWRDGLRAARQAGVPVSTVGVGDPIRESVIPTPQGPLMFHGNEVMTRLHEDLLEEIARRSGGVYLAARTAPPDLRAFFREHVAGRPGRDAVEAAPPEPATQQGWFLAAALALLGVTVGGTGGSPRTAVRGLWGITRKYVWKPRAALLLPASLALLSAAPAFAPDPDEWVRRGNAALDRDRPAAALDCYARAAERSTDPGLVAFNRATAFARLGRTREAELDYRRSLDDAAGPRRPRALYNLGTCLLLRSQGKQPGPLREAVGCFERALDSLPADDPLRPDTAHNLELAKLLWRQARAADPNRPDEPPDGGNQPPEASPRPEGALEPSGAPSGRGEPGGAPAGQPTNAADGKAPRPTDQSPPGKGNLPPLPDQDALAPLSPEDTRAYLEQAAGRIERARREQLRQTAPAPSQKFPEW